MLRALITEIRYDCRMWWLSRAATIIKGLIALSTTAVAIVLMANGVENWFTLQRGRAYFWLRGPWVEAIARPRQVQIIGLDDESRVALNIPASMPIRRDYLASGLERVVNCKPQMIIADLQFPPDQLTPEADRRIAAALRAVPSTIWNGDTGNPQEEAFGSDSVFKDAAKLRLTMLLSKEGNYVTGVLPAGSENSPTVLTALRELGGYSVATPSANDWINFYGPTGTMPYHSLTKAISMPQEELCSAMKNQIVLVGYHRGSTPYKGVPTKDDHFTLVSSEAMPGVEIHANAIMNLLNQEWITRLHPSTELDILILGASLWSMILLSLPTRAALILAATIPAVEFTISYFVFTTAHLMISGLTIPWLLSLAVIFVRHVYVSRRGHLFVSDLSKRTGLSIGERG